MTNKAQIFNQQYLKKEPMEIRPGQQIKVYQKFIEGGKEKTHFFEGLVIAKKHGKEIGSTITIRRMAAGVGTEIILPLHSPLITKIEILRKNKVRKSKLYYLRGAKGKRAKLKEKK
ncbi:MAG: 50S ribosomal protein L19 [Parcubacteria group bacterium CG10_big_fil_rev_8_21_14_0_10_35_15]|nr:MAG: 50S ribosomal protein L19 [Parcubacteria group bacterium CG10_big_fil_rev_8_21_14_0_10_35_15]